MRACRAQGNNVVLPPRPNGTVLNGDATVPAVGQARVACPGAGSFMCTVTFWQETNGWTRGIEFQCCDAVTGQVVHTAPCWGPCFPATPMRVGFNGFFSGMRMGLWGVGITNAAGSGGGLAAMACPAGQVVIGVHGWFGTGMDDVQPLCRAAYVPCAAGTFATGANHCAACGAGSFSGATGATACAACGAGMFMNGTGASVCDECPPGTLASEGATGCAPCAAGTFGGACGAAGTVVVRYSASGTHETCSPDAPLDGLSAWCGVSSTTAGAGQFWLQLDAGRIVWVTSVVTQGRSSSAQWVTSFQVSHSRDGHRWTLLPPAAGNRDRNTRVTTALDGVFARFVRLLPTAWNQHPSMRAGLTVGPSRCAAGTFSTTVGASGSDACIRCAAGTFATGEGAAIGTCVPRSLASSWLFKDAENGFYYLNLPRPQSAGWHADGWGQRSFTYTRVRIHSRLSAGMTSIQLFVRAVGNAARPCDSTTLDAKYGTGPYVVDFGGFYAWSKRAGIAIDLRGSLFGLPDGTNSWITACTANSDVPVRSCSGPQTCSISFYATPGWAFFRGRLSVLNSTAFDEAVYIACALNQSDPLLQCEGHETFCAMPCAECGVGRYASVAGSTMCIGCAAGAFTVGGRASSSGDCRLCEAGTFSTGGEGCRSCGRTTFATTLGATGASECAPCRGGGAFLHSATRSCVACGGNASSYCPVGGGCVDACIACPPRTRASNNATTCVSGGCFVCPAGGYCDGSYKVRGSFAVGRVCV